MSRTTAIVMVACILVVIGAYVVYPLSATVQESLASSDGVTVARYLSLLDPSNSAAWEAVTNSIVVSLLSVVFSAILGTFFAFVLTQTSFKGRTLVARLSILPLALPPLVGVISFMFVFGESGFVPRFLQLFFRLSSVPFYLDGVWAIVAVHVYSFYVYFYLLLSNSLQRLDMSLVEAASGLGSGPWRTFVRVILPQLRPAYIGGSILTFMTSMASFSAPFLFGGTHRFMTVEIYSAKLNGDMGMASAESILLMSLSVVFFLMLKFSQGGGRGSASKGVARQGVIPVVPWLRAVSLGVFALCFLIELFPLLTIVVVSFVREGSWTWQLFPTDFSVENYLRLVREPHFSEPITNSLAMSMVALVICLAVGVPSAYLIVKGKLNRRFTALFDALATFPFAIPGTIIAVSLILAFNVPSLLSGYAILVGSFWILPLAYAVRSYPLLIRSTASSLSHLDDSLMEASSASGAGFWFGFRRVIMPLIAPGIISGGVLVVISSIGEFVSSILLYTYSNRPISIEILSQLRSYNFGGAAAYSVILLLCITALMWISTVVLRRSHRGDAGLLF